jgi:hypothetical protein
MLRPNVGVVAAGVTLLAIALDGCTTHCAYAPVLRIDLTVSPQRLAVGESAVSVAQVWLEGGTPEDPLAGGLDPRSTTLSFSVHPNGVVELDRRTAPIDPHGRAEAFASAVAPGRAWVQAGASAPCLVEVVAGESG